MKEINVTIGQWYAAEGAAGDTITNPSTGRAIATVEDGKQAFFYATSAVVVASSDSVQVHRANFKSAPAKLMALGLLGGGSTNALPAGYIAAEFLEGRADIDKYNRPYLKTGVFTSDDTGMFVRFSLEKDFDGYVMGGSVDNYRRCQPYRVRANNSALGGWNEQYYAYPTVNLTDVFTSSVNFKNDRKITLNKNNFSSSDNIKPLTVDSREIYLFGDSGISNFNWCGRIYEAAVSKEEELIREFKPAVDELGKPCMFDKVTNTPFYTANNVSFVVGFTLTQARQLSKLPATGGTLIISLPTGYESDAGVVSALETARSNGWTLTIQTYTPDTAPAGASTFALRRIWVRRTQNEQGAYVSADGSRWQVEWCVDMLTPDGSTPDAYGYELFRSQEAAVAYWELEPWVDPEAEELLTNSTTNEHE